MSSTDTDTAAPTEHEAQATDTSGIQRLAEAGLPSEDFHRRHCAALREIARYVDALIADHETARLDMGRMTDDLTPLACKLGQLGAYVNEGCQLADSLTRGDFSILQSESLSRNPLVPTVDVIQENISRSLKLTHALAPSAFSVQDGEQANDFAQMFNQALEDLRERQRTLERSAYTDALTGADNRAAYNKRIEELWESASFVSMAYVDIDNLKACNDRFGHDEGDLYISQTYLYLRLFLDENSSVFRVGGDEFIVLSTKSTEDALATQLEKCRQALVANSSGPDDSMTFSFSYGCSQANPSAGDSRQQMTRDADRKMYAYKLAHKGDASTAPSSTPSFNRFGVDDRVFEAISMASEGRYPFVYDIETGESRWSPNAVRDLGFPAEHIKGTMDVLRPHIHPDDLSAHESDLHKIVRREKHHRNIQYRMLNAEGRYVMCECRGYRLDADGDRPALFVGVVANHDATEASDSGTGLPNNRSLVNAIWECRREGGSVGFVALHVEGIDRFNALYGYAAGDLVLRTLATRMVAQARGHARAFRGRGVQMVLVAQGISPTGLHDLARTVEKAARASIEVRGESFEPVVHVASMFCESMTQQPFVIMRSLDERMQTVTAADRAASAKAPEAGTAHVNALTGLASGSDFLKRASALRRAEPERPMSLVRLDIGFLRMFNEWHGRQEGDELLADVGRALREEERAGDALAGYWGQDDFTLLLPSLHKRISAAYARVEAVVAAHDAAVGFRPSMGVYSLDADEELGTDQYARATFACQQAKQGLKSRVSYFSPIRYDEEEREHLLLAQFQHALSDGEMTFFAQPQCELATRRIVGAEALARWVRPDGTVVPPDTFVPLLEKTGFVTMLDKHVWHAVVDWLHERLAQGLAVVPISVNVSRVDIESLDVAAYLSSLVERHGISPSLLKVEITETTYAQDEKGVNALARRLQERDFAVYMDDFGSGQSSLNMLKTTAVDVLKLDRGFMPANAGEMSRCTSILRSMVGMARMLDLPMVVEGVETEEQVGMLQHLGVRYVQGYHFYRPLPVAQLEEVLADKDVIDPRGLLKPTARQSKRL